MMMAVVTLMSGGDDGCNDFCVIQNVVLSGSGAGPGMCGVVECWAVATRVASSRLAHGSFQVKQTALLRYSG